MTKTALITGATGGIGGGFARELSRRGYQLLLPVRNSASLAAQELLPLPGALVVECNVEDAAATDHYFRSLMEEGKHISVFILAAGVFKRDRKFEGATLAERQQRATAELIKANYVTKQTVFHGLEHHFSSEQKHMTGIVIGSHAANFGPDHEFRPEQEGYVAAMQRVALLAKTMQNKRRFKELILELPGRIDTPALREELALPADEPGMISPEEYAAAVLDKAGL